MANVDLSIRRYRARFCKRSSAQRLVMQLESHDGGFLFGRWSLSQSHRPPSLDAKLQALSASRRRASASLRSPPVIRPREFASD